MDCSPPDSSVHGDSPGQNTGLVATPSSREDSPPGLMLCPPSGLIPNPGIKLGSPALQVDSLPAELPGTLDEHVSSLLNNRGTGVWRYVRTAPHWSHC